jgi:hypothetical protein
MPIIDAKGRLSLEIIKKSARKTLYFSNSAGGPVKRRRPKEKEQRRISARDDHPSGGPLASTDQRSLVFIKAE